MSNFAERCMSKSVVVAKEENPDNIVYETFTDEGVAVIVYMKTSFVPSEKEKTKTGKTKRIPITHRKVVLQDDKGNDLAVFPVTRRGGAVSVSDSRQKDKNCALMEGMKGYTLSTFRAELVSLLGAFIAGNVIKALEL